MQNIRVITTTVLLTGVIALAGCSDLTQSQENTLGGAVLGTAVGAGIGAASGNVGTGAAIGAAAGAVGGAMISK